ncbi:MAG: hypothetical protein JWQ11_367 [Rhizobacter sp.]|nr:hypothetical protein [Rhizobacter sp.]
MPLPGQLLIIGPIGLGDTVLALPTLRQLQQASPATEVVWVGKAAHEPVVRMAGVGGFVAMEALALADGGTRGSTRGSAGAGAGAFQGERLALDRFDAMLTFNDVSADVLGPGRSLRDIPVRIGAANGLRRQWCNHLVHTKLLGYPRHEALRNLRLLRPFGLPTSLSLDSTGSLGRLSAARVKLPTDLTADLSATGRYVVLHPFSAGHAREWPIDHWRRLACLLADEGITAVFTGSAEDGVLMQAEWDRQTRPAEVIDAFGRLDLSQLATLLIGASAMVACSTGPLHLAASLGAPAIGLFVPRKGLGMDRWAPLGQAAVGLQAHRRCPQPRCEPSSCRCIAEVSVEQVAMTVHSSIAARPAVDRLPSNRVVSDEPRTV